MSCPKMSAHLPSKAMLSVFNHCLLSHNEWQDTCLPLNGRKNMSQKNVKRRGREEGPRNEPMEMRRDRDG